MSNLNLFKMAFYFSAQIKIHDPDEYQKYLDKAMDVFRKYKGQYLAVDNAPVLIEGNWDYTRSVLIKFESKKDFEGWYYSDEYQEILKHRLKGAVCDSVLLEGVYSND